MENKKIIEKEAFSKMREGFREQGKTVVLCHGVFDVLHYGHIEHLKEAKAQGDVLVVSVTAAEYVNKGPGRPYFNDEQRMGFLACIECVDYVILSGAVTVHEIVKCVRPDIYVKGKEYAEQENDFTGNIGSEQEIVESFGGRIYFTGGEVYSSTKLLNNFFGALPKDVVKASQKLRNEYGTDIVNQISSCVRKFSNVKVLVVGDLIIDEYSFCRVQGVTMKDAAMSTRYESTERYAGGALAIARHLTNFAGEVAFLSMMGTEKDIAEFVLGKIKNINSRIVQDKHFITPLKKRYLKRHPLRQEYDKLFSVNRLLTTKDTLKIDYKNFYRNLEEMSGDYDVVAICDYGHGLLDERAIRILESKAKFLAVNCQTNSSNYGLNPITKYSRMDAFVVDERELLLPFGQSIERNEKLLEKLMERFSSRYAWLTLGAHGAVGMRGKEMAYFPAVTLHIKDTVGAGDAFYSLAVMAAATKMPITWATLLGNVAGAIKTNMVGNVQPIAKTDLLKFVSTVLNV